MSYSPLNSLAPVKVAVLVKDLEEIKAWYIDQQVPVSVDFIFDG